jgi:hypothetical protein
MHTQNNAAAAPRILHDAKPAIINLPKIIDRAVSLAIEIERDGCRAKFYAYDAITSLFPKLDKGSLAKRLSFNASPSPDSQLLKAKGRDWWQADGTGRVVSSLMALARGQAH